MRYVKACVSEPFEAGLPSRGARCYRFGIFITATAAAVLPIAMISLKRISLLAALVALTSAAHTQVPPSSDFPPSHDGPPPHGPGFRGHQRSRASAVSGRDAEMNAVYHDVLSKTHDPALRHYVYVALARNQLKAANVDQAIDTIRKSLDEDIDTLDKQLRCGPKR